MTTIQAPNQLDHVLEVGADLTTIEHPDACQPFRCPAGRLMGQAAGLPAGRYWVGVNDLGDRLLIGDRVQPAPDLPEVLALLRAAGERSRATIRPANVDQVHALTLLYAAIIGERAELVRLMRGLLLLHLVFPGNGQPYPACPSCHGTGQLPPIGGADPGHCHCRCDVCTCGEPLCGGPCESVAVMLDALVLHGLPAEAIDVPRTLAKLHLEGARRIVARTTDQATVSPVGSAPGTANVTVSYATAAERIERDLRAEGYQCERRAVPGPPGTVQIRAMPTL